MKSFFSYYFFIIFFSLLSIITSQLKFHIKYDVGFNTIWVSDSKKSTAKNLSNTKDFISSLKTQCPHVESMKSSFTKRYEDTFIELLTKDMDDFKSDIFIYGPIKENYYAQAYNRKIDVFKLNGDAERDFILFYQIAKNNEFNQWDKFEVVFKDGREENMFRSFICLVNRIDKDTYEVVFIYSSKSFNEASREKVEEDAEEDSEDEKNGNFTLDENGNKTETCEGEINKDTSVKKKVIKGMKEVKEIISYDYSDRQRKCLDEWFKIINLKALCDLFSIEDE